MKRLRQRGIWWNSPVFFRLVQFQHFSRCRCAAGNFSPMNGGPDFSARQRQPTGARTAPSGAFIGRLRRKPESAFFFTAGCRGRTFAVHADDVVRHCFSGASIARSSSSPGLFGDRRPLLYAGCSSSSSIRHQHRIHTNDGSGHCIPMLSRTFFRKENRRQGLRPFSSY